MKTKRMVAVFGLAAIVGAPALGSSFDRDPAEIADGLAQRHIASWRDGSPLEQRTLRDDNPEWDLMARTFSVLAFANLALRQPSTRADHVARIDRIIAATIRDAEANSQNHFLMAYAQRGRFRDPVHGRSLFLEGETALMIGSRLLLEPEQPALRAELRRRVERIVAQLEAAPRLSGESYPNEVWTFCNTVALAAIRVSDVLEGEDHSPLFRRWVATAKSALIDPRTGLLISSYTWDGEPLDGPEGSSIWLVAHLLSLIDEDFARDQYARAKKELAGSLFGFAFAREWPASWPGRIDVDSGPIVPLLEASPSSSGLALLGAASFGDRELSAGLIRSLELTAFPIREDGALRYAASNQLGDAVLLYALVSGPLFEQVRAAPPVAFSR